MSSVAGPGAGSPRLGRRCASSGGLALAAAAAALSSARFAWRTARAPAASATTISTADPARRARCRRIIRAWARARSSAAPTFRRVEPFRGVEEGGLGVGEDDVGPGPPLQRPGQPDPAVQLAVRPPELVPGVGGGAQVAQDPLPLDVLVEPGPQPRPGARQCLVGDLDDTGVAGDQAGR